MYKFVNLSIADAEAFMRFCKANGIYAEKSYYSATLRHFEVRIDSPDMEAKCNQFLANL